MGEKKRGREGKYEGGVKKGLGGKKEITAGVEGVKEISDERD